MPPSLEAALLGKVCGSCVLDSVRRLSALRSRYAMGTHGEAEASVALLETMVSETVARAGGAPLSARLRMVRQPFTGLDARKPLANLLVRLEAPRTTNETVLVGAHFDCTNRRPGTKADESQPAPGADDNGSGVAAVLEILRVITEAIAAGDWVPRAAILFAFFGAEEQVSQQRVLAR